ncbi:MAG: DUF1697 domain-containing protein [Bauldia litoralis]
MTTFVALLRATNVGGNNLVKMAALKALCQKAGFGDVRTLLQSGNVVFTASGKPAAIADGLKASIANAFGFSIAVFVRTAGELETTVGANPFAREAADAPGQVVAMFVDRDPAAEALERLAADHAGPERIAAGDRVLYIHYPDGLGRSKLTNALVEKRLGVTGTARNWNTMTRLLAMVGEPAAD